MIGLNGKPLTNKEYHGVFTDKLNCFVKNTFHKKESLLFVTYQPKILELDPQKVTEYTHQLFKQFHFVEVLEQNFKQHRAYNYGEYDGGYHSHIIIREKDYNCLTAEQLRGLDIVDKEVWNLERLINKYLCKQAGVTRSRLLPSVHIPLDTIQTVTLGPETVTETIYIKLNVKVLYQYTLNNYSPQEQEIFTSQTKKNNKIDWFYMYINDT